MEEIVLDFEDINLVTVTEYLKKYNDQAIEYFPALELAGNDVSEFQMEYMEARLESYFNLRLTMQICHTTLGEVAKANKSDQEIISTFQNEVMKLGLSEKSAAISLSQLNKQMREVYKDKIENPKDIIGLPLGIPSFDKLTLGLQKSQFYIVAARPSIGKTSFGNDIALAGGKNGMRTAIFTKEMGRSIMHTRLLSGVSRISTENWLTGTPPATMEKYEEGVKKLDLPIFIIDKNLKTEVDIIRQTRKLRPDLVVVDYIQLFQSSQKSGTRDIEIGQITQALKEMAVDHDIPVVALCQLNRKVEAREDKRPRLSDLRESGNIEQDADAVIGLWRENKKETTSVVDIGEILLLKNRNGKVGRVKAIFLTNSCSWHERDKSEWGDDEDD